MNLSHNLSCLLYSTSTDRDATALFSLNEAVTCIGRLERDQVEPQEAGHLKLELPTVSVRHAKIVRTDSGYRLENWQGRYGIGLYERELPPGQSHLLVHCDVFRIPALEQHARFQFLATPQQTHIAPLSVERSRGIVYVFGGRIKW